ncbi:MAG: VWA domain-containing protein [Chloroflexi bacterium]|nr:VWA domain-containing protein [Chloroflexota bacterium]
MNFTAPLALLLLLFIPYFVWLGRPRAGAARWREWTSLGLRLLIIFVLVLSLAGAQVVRAADDLAVVFLVDASDSIGPEQAEQAEAFVRQSIESLGPADQAAVIVFGSNALVERPMSGLAELAPVTSVPQTLHTDIAEAIRLGLALFPAGSARRLVLLSDGVATLGDTQEAARLAAVTGVQIDVVPLTRPAGEVEVLLTNVDAPTRVGEGEAFTIEITAESTTSMPAGLRILAGPNVVYEGAVQLRPGVNNFSVRLRATAQEFARYVVQMAPLQDTYYQNNQLAAFTEIVGPPRVLIVAHDGTMDDEGNPLPDESPQLQLALEATGLLVDRVTPAELPAGLAELSNYSSIILVNVNAKNLSPRTMAGLQSYVRDLGGGLVAVGGPQSYGMGGYFRTPLEETLPVDMQIKDQERFPSVSIVIVIDRSGSMAAQEGGVTKIQLAAEGAVRVVQLLNDFDEITVIPVDTQPSNPIGPASAADRDNVISQIRQIGAGGGGIYVRTGMEAAADALAESANQVKHVILLADGADSEEKEGVPELIEALVAEGVTISVVSIGNGQDVTWLQQMAELGGGRFHFTDQAANLPQIFTQETTAIQRSYLVEERFFPDLANNSPILSGIQAVPPLYGYVGTSSKETAQVVLETHLGDPLLATWQYGLGRAVAWTSDATGRWGVDWVRWDGFPTFWSNLVRWTISQRRESNVETAVNFSGEEARLMVDARDSNGVYLNSLEMEANVVAPTGEVVNLILRQVAPGRYEGNFTPADDGAYFIRVAGTATGEAEAVVGQTSGWVLGYSPEYRQFEANPQLLLALAEMTGGRDLSTALSAGDVSSVWAHNLPGQEAARPIWPWLTLLAVLLLPLDIATRRLVVSRRDMQRAWAATFGRLRPQAAPVAGRTEQVSRLFQAKQRAGVSRPEEPAATPPPVMRQDATQTPPAARPAETPGRPSAPPPIPEKTPPARPTPAPPEAGGSLASRLLEKKRQQREEE